MPTCPIGHTLALLNLYGLFTPPNREVLLLSNVLTAPAPQATHPKKEVSSYHPRSIVTLWVLVCISVAVWIFVDPSAWDVHVYASAMRSLRLGHDPYAEAMAVQHLYQSQPVHLPYADPPWSYVYSPLTLPLLRLIAIPPFALTATLYWLLYAAAALAQLWAVLRAATFAELRVFRYLAPVSLFFPGLLANGILMGGNVAYLLYAAVLLAAVLGWRRGTWLPFYLAVLAASCIKMPLLTLVGIPVFSARRQVLPAAATVAASLALFVAPAFLWPSLFRHYLQAVELQFSINRDFGCAPAGLFSGMVYDRHIPYVVPSLVFFAAYALPLCALLFVLSRRYLRGDFPLRQWVPVLLVGVILLNPRIQEYDAAPIALPLALICSRFLSAHRKPTRTRILTAGSVLLILANVVGAYSWNLRKLIDGPLIVLLFLAGCWTLLRHSPTPNPTDLPSTI